MDKLLKELELFVDSNPHDAKLAIGVPRITKIIKNLHWMEQLAGREIPKRPLTHYEEDGTLEITCPLCNDTLDRMVNFCSECGQKLKWDEG